MSLRFRNTATDHQSRPIMAPQTSDSSIPLLPTDNPNRNKKYESLSVTDTYAASKSSTHKVIMQIVAAASFVGLTLFLYWYLARSGASSSSGPYYLVHGAVVHTVDEKAPRAEAFVVKGNRFVAVGTKAALLKAHPNARQVNLNGRTTKHVVWPPGIRQHLLQQGLAYLQADVTGAESIAKVRERLVHYLDLHPNIEAEKDFLVGKGWDQNQWGETFPTAADLDAHPRLKAVPICLYRNDYHAYWLNAAALRIVAPHFGPGSEPVEGGEAIRDEAGTLTGIFVDGAMDRVADALPEPGKVRTERALTAVTTRMVQVGLTGLHDAGVAPWEIEVLKREIDAGRMPIRNYAMIRCPDQKKYCGDLVPKLLDYKGRLTVGSVKLFLDGALGSWGALLKEPYTDEPEKSGFLRMSTELLSALITKWAKSGYQVNIHCIGDRANSVALDGFETAFVALGVNGTEKARNARMRIEHAQIIVLSTISRKPFSAVSDMAYAEKRLGPQRIKGAYAWNSLLESGVQHLPLGSDFPIEDLNPLLGIHAAITRLDLAGKSPHGPDGWYTNERITPLEALRGFTLDAAWAAFQDNDLGSIAVGKKADFAVFNKDFITSPDLILRAQCVATIVDGVAVFGHV
ncbi:hypothetical protein HKX48_007423 [Thoreauomyces humboldtii]|nr:hypothetical protein HKX48_007423 [Thoreauomyces humboldtii]